MTTSGRTANTPRAGGSQAAAPAAGVTGGRRPAAAAAVAGSRACRSGPPGGSAGRDSDFVQSLDRGLAVIRAFGPGRERLSLSDVARETGLTRAAARRFLLTLVRARLRPQ